MYDRAKRPKKTILGSSGFEHVFIGECCKGGEAMMAMVMVMVMVIMTTMMMKMTQVGGFHNWYHFYMLEAAGMIDYRGYMEHVGNRTIQIEEHHPN